MDALGAILIIEEGANSEAEVLAAWQLLLDTGIVWQLQGSYQRGAVALLEAGLIVASEAAG